VVAVVVDEVEDLVVGRDRERRALRDVGAQADRHLLDPAPCARRPPVHRDEGAGDRRVRRDHLAELVRGDVLAGARVGVGDRLVEVRDQAGVDVVGERPRVDAERVLQAQEHRHRERPLVVLDLVQVARRDPEPPRQRRLAQAAVLAHPPQPGPHEELAPHRRSPDVRNLRRIGTRASQTCTRQVIVTEGTLRTLRGSRQGAGRLTHVRIAVPSEPTPSRDGIGPAGGGRDRTAGQPASASEQHRPQRRGQRPPSNPCGGRGDLPPHPLTIEPRERP
jgi:hypothetical protein